MKIFKNYLLAGTLAILATSTPAYSVVGYPVHDPASLAETLKEMGKELKEWAKQSENMQTLNKLNTQISEYSETLNGYVGDAKAAAAKINEAQDLLNRLKNLAEIEDLLDLENEISALTDITKVTDLLDKKSGIYGKLETEVNGKTIERKIEDYKRYALTNARVDSYEKERAETVDSLEMVSTQLAEALNEARNATTQAEQLAVLTKIEALNVQLSLTQTRFNTRMYDLHTQTLANADRRLMEDKNYQDTKATASKISSDAMKKSHEEGTENLKTIDYDGYKFNK